SLTTIFGLISAEQLRRLKAGAEKMKIVHQRVTHLSRGQHGWQLWLPDAFGKPSSRRLFAEMPFDVTGEALDLFALVFRRDNRENRLEKSPPDDFPLLTADHGTQQLEILGMVSFDPQQQRT